MLIGATDTLTDSTGSDTIWSNYGLFCQKSSRNYESLNINLTKSELKQKIKEVQMNHNKKTNLSFQNSHSFKFYIFQDINKVILVVFLAFQGSQTLIKRF